MVLKFSLGSLVGSFGEEKRNQNESYIDDDEDRETHENEEIIHIRETHPEIARVLIFISIK